MIFDIFNIKDSEVWIVYVINCGKLFIYWCLATFAVIATVTILQRVKKTRIRWISNIKLVAASILLFVASVLLSARSDLTKLCLDAEDIRTEEWAYNNLFQPDNIDACIKLLKNQAELPNVRFYAACKLGELLAKSSESDQSYALFHIALAPSVTPTFFGTNSINQLCEKVFRTSNIAVPYNITDIVLDRKHAVLNDK